MKRLAYIICLVELALMVLVPLAAWLASVLNYDVVNLVSEEGLRWLFNHGGHALLSLQLAFIILLTSAIGAVDESGIVRDIRQFQHNRKAYYTAGAFFFLSVVMLLCPIFVPHNALLGVTGSLLPSPWLMGTPLAICVIVITTSIIYSAVKGTLGSFMGIPHMITLGISKYSFWVVDAMMLSLIIRTIKFIIS